MIDEKMEKWEINNPEKLTTVVEGKWKGRGAEVYETLEDDYILTNLEDGKYYACDWCNQSSSSADTDEGPKFFKTKRELAIHFLDEHDLCENFEEIEVSRSGAIEPFMSEAMSVAEEILKKKGLNISVNEDDAIKIALNNEVDVDL